MARKRKRRGKSRKKPLGRSASDGHSAHSHHELWYVKQHIDKLWEFYNEVGKRVHDIEIHSDLMQRLLVDFALRKLGMRLSELRRMIRRAEKEAIADSEVYHLKELFELPAKEPPHANSFKKPKRAS